MNYWQNSQSQATRTLVMLGGAALVSLMVILMYWSTSQAAGGPAEWRGLITAKPPSGTAGEWSVGGRTFVVTNQTELKGTLDVNSCAKVRYEVAGAINRARQIESQALSDCTPEATETPEPHGTIPPTPDDHGGHGGDGVHGRITALPDGGLMGNWVISGTTYVVTTTTQLERRFGPFVAGACVQVKSDGATPVATALRIRTIQDFVCKSDEDHGGDHGGNHDHPGMAHGELFGLIETLPISFPTSLTGTWQIGGMSFVADNNTEFNQEHGAFAISTTVAVKFYIDAANVNRAIKIESKFGNDHHGHDDDGIHHGAEGVAFGAVGSFPAGKVGVWVVAGIEYTATNKTEFEEERGAFAQGVQVKVQYFLDSNQQRVAREIETTNSNGGASDASHAVLFGFVEVAPAAGFTGTWQVGNVTFVTDLNTQFKETHGLLAKGAFVSVEYTTTSGSNLIAVITTLVPPGCGEHSHTGKIEHMGGDTAAASVTANTVWRIGGQDFVVTPATLLNDSLGALAVDQTAAVNSYTAADGTLVATQIQGVSLNNQLFMPLVRR